MKTTILKISFIFLLLLTMGAGCEKDEEPNYDSTGIAGKWQLLQFPETCVGHRDAMIEITSDFVFKKYIDGELDFLRWRTFAMCALLARVIHFCLCKQDSFTKPRQQEGKILCANY